MKLGHSAADLFGPWRFHVGDEPAWAQPGFDDSHWETVDLHSPDDPPDPELGSSGFVAGWTSHGHPNYSGYAWYRLRVHVEGTDGKLAIKMPDQFDDAYQVFVDGQQIGEFGHFGQRRVWAFPSQPRGYPLPATVQNGTVTIAIRMWMNSATRFSGPDAGGLHGPPMLGSAQTINDRVALDWDGLNHDVGSGFLEMLVLLLALTVASAHFALDRSDKAYLLLALVSLVTLVGNLILQLGNYSTLFSSTFVLLARDVVLTPVRIGLWVLFFAKWFQVAHSRRLAGIVFALVGILAVGTLMLRPPLHGQFVPVAVGTYLDPALVWIKLALAGTLFWVAYQGIRKHQQEGWFALPAILLAVVANYQHELRLARIHVQYAVFGYKISLGQLSTMLSLLLVTLMASRRFLLAQRQRLQYQLEVQQASELQQVIIPREVPRLPGLSVESEYRPSRDVGGDFFQIIPNSREGSALIVVGDVTGKGLSAGMLGALIVGAIDTAASQEQNPADILKSVNERLCGRGLATATCLVVRIDADRTLTASNAGHLPPYINTAELGMEGALPLGTLPDMSYDTVTCQLADGDVVTMLTDGVIEAQNEHGDLFGFERVEQMVSENATANEIANAVQRFGQEDDILILRVQCT
ncbi:PP2C family protein-serine/threonine phosphatase [Terriglobus aquaticus]|uniref:SpoIIE family protein phosphatase n=1 Tax=Terriglobus aquaticus TaxID=940139 RepID=A0ABW9KGD5_9BACT|nr:SpoIIE family protein phosphatase [Terriglobus aquaticus]